MSLPPFFENWLAVVATFVGAGDADTFGQCFDVTARNSQTKVHLAQAVRSNVQSEDAELDAIREIVDPDDQWSSLARMVHAYIQYLRGLHPNIGVSQRFELLLKFMNVVSSAADHNNGAVLNVLVLSGAKQLTRLGIISDALANDGSHKYAEQAHSVVQKLFNVSLKGVRAPNELGKRETSVGIINCLFKLASKMGRIGSMTTIIVNLNNVLPSINITSDTRFSVADRCTYAYFTGMEHFQNAQFLKAAKSLQESFDLCHPSFLRNRRKILMHLVTSNILLGRFPSSSLYNLPEAAQFRDVFAPIIKAIQLGHFSNFEKALLRAKKWLVHYHIFYDLEIRCETLIWRNLIKNVFAISGSTAKNGVESIGLDKIYEAALLVRAGLQPQVVGQNANGQRVEFREKLNESSILSIVLGLIDNGWLNGYVSTDKSMLAGWSSKARLVTKLVDVRNQYVGMLWGGENKSGVTEKEATGLGEKTDKEAVANGFSTAAPTQPAFGGFNFVGAFGNQDSNGGGYNTDPGDDMEMEL